MNSTIEKLKKIKLDETRLFIIQNEILKLETSATSVTPAYGGEVVSGSRNLDKMGDAVSEIADLKAAHSELLRRRNYYLSIIDRIGEIVEDAEEAEKQITVLYKRYFEHLSFKAIASEMHFAERTVGYIHGRALQSVEKLLEEYEYEEM